VNWRTFLLGMGTGLASGYALKEIVSKNQSISADKALANAKAAFKKHGPIEGSWISVEKQPFSKAFLEYQVYIGGITRTVDGVTEQYEFIVDASTGSILDAYLL
jgi:predicted small secreted protein